jgi:2-methylaconitate cis-trans-isomerase PrpF
MQTRIPAVFMRGGTSKATFAQVLVKEARVDYSSNCGNMTSAMGPFAVANT